MTRTLTDEFMPSKMRKELSTRPSMCRVTTPQQLCPDVCASVPPLFREYQLKAEDQAWWTLDQPNSHHEAMQSRDARVTFILYCRYPHHPGCHYKIVCRTRDSVIKGTESQHGRTHQPQTCHKQFSSQYQLVDWICVEPFLFTVPEYWEEMEEFVAQASSRGCMAAIFKHWLFVTSRHSTSTNPFRSTNPNGMKTNDLQQILAPTTSHAHQNLPNHHGHPNPWGHNYSNPSLTHLYTVTEANPR